MNQASRYLFVQIIHQRLFSTHENILNTFCMRQDSMMLSEYNKKLYTEGCYERNIW